MHFEIVGDITDVEIIATGRGIKRLKSWRKRHGGMRWRKLKGNATFASSMVRFGGRKFIGRTRMAWGDEV